LSQIGDSAVGTYLINEDDQLIPLGQEKDAENQAGSSHDLVAGTQVSYRLKQK